MKQTAAIVLLVASLIGGATYYGLTRGGSKAASPAVVEKIALAEKFLDQNEPQKTLEIYDELATEGISLDEKNAYNRLMALDLADRHTDAATAADEFLKSYPESEKKTSVELIRLTSGLATAGLSNPQLRKSVEDFLARNPEHPDAYKLQIALARQDISVGDMISGTRRLEQVMQHAENDKEIVELAEPLGRANLQALTSTMPSDTDTIYTVKSGDSIWKIAKDQQISQELLLSCNGIDDPSKLRVGQQLKVPNVDFSLEVDLNANTMLLKNHGEFFKLYSVRTGRVKGSTPTGSYKILNKKTNPTWRPGNGYTYGPGDPNNELGTRWMAFEGDILGIHGTLHPETVGEYASNGCVGMHTADVEELFDLIIEGTTLTIKGEQDTARHRVIEAPEVPAPQEVASSR